MDETFSLIWSVLNTPDHELYTNLITLCFHILIPKGQRLLLLFLQLKWLLSLPLI